MSSEIKDRCIYCGGDVYYQSGQQLIKCSFCGHTLVTAKFENEIVSRKKAEEEHAKVREKLKKAEQDKQAADNRLFAALSDLDSLDHAQGEIRDLLKALKADTADSSHVLGDMLRVLISGQQDAQQKLQLLSHFSDRLLMSQNDVLAKVQTQSEIIGQLYTLEMDAQERQRLAGEFMLWMQESHAEDVQKLQQIRESSGELLEEQKKINDNVSILRRDAADIQQRLKDFEDKWESARLQELHHLYHQAANYQHDKKYDKAEEYYQKVLTRGGPDSEVYWRLLMCHYCLTYQKDDEGNLIPIILNPDLTDPDEMSLRKELDRHLTRQERPVYEAELAKIDRILDKYRFLKDQVKYDVFISVKQELGGRYTEDSDIASDLYDFLTGKGLRVFNSRRTAIPAGREYEPYIISALMSAKALIVVGTTADNMNAQWVKNEWSRFQWLQHREKEKTGKTDRVLICYLAKGMQAKQIPKALNPSRQAVYDGVKAHDELLSGLAFLLKDNDSREETIKNKKESEDSTYYRVINQMTAWLFMGKYTKVLDKYEELTETGLYLTRSQLHLSALCAEKHVPDIQKIVCSELMLDQMPLYKLAVKLCQREEEKEDLRKLLAQNKEWRSGLHKAARQESQEARKEQPERQEKPKTDQELYDLGVRYFLGQGVARDEAEAIKWFQQAAALGHAGAAKWLKDIQKVSKERAAEDWYQKGLSYAKTEEYTEAVKWFRGAAENGHAGAQNWLGYCYEKGLGIQADAVEAENWYQMASALGHEKAKENLERINAIKNKQSAEDWYRRGQDAMGKKDYTEALTWYRKAAQAGYAKAQTSLGICYEKGTGTAVNKQEAVKWYKMAAEGGEPWGQFDYGLCLKNGIGVPKKEAEAVYWFQQAAQAGIDDAQNWLGICYEKGIGVKVNEQEAVRWYKKAAEKGNLYGQRNYGLCLRDGIGIPKNEAEAVKWFRKAAEAGKADAQTSLGLCYEKGMGVAVNKQEAARWYKIAAENGDAWGQHNYGLCLKNGSGVPKDEAEAVKWFRKAAEAGNVDAQNWLGVCYEQGIGVTANMQEAVRWYKMAAENGDTWGQYNYGLCLKNGTGVPKDKAEAVKWFRKAAEAGNVDAQNWLGVCYEQGIGVTANMQEAVRWYKKAAESGDIYAQRNYALCLREGSGVSKNEAEAVKWFRKAAEAGKADAQTSLGLCYEKGMGVAVNMQEAARWYKIAAENGDAWGQHNYGLCLKNGSGVPKDEAEAVKWFRKAAEAGNARAQYWMGACYENGLGIPKNKEEAKVWYQKAADQGHEESKKNLEKLNKKKWF